MRHIHPVLLWDEEGATLVDAGYPGVFAQLQAAVEQRLSSFDQLKRVIVTHQDWDHIGTVPDILQARAGQVDVFAHVQEKPYLEGSIPNYKLTAQGIKDRIQALPEPWRAQGAAVFHNLPQFQVNRPLEDGDVLPFHGGIDVIHTPGHTPGHLCLYVRAHRLLITGDQLRIDDNGILAGPAPEHTPDLALALESLKKLRNYDIERIICYHGGTYTADATARIAELCP